MCSAVACYRFDAQSRNFQVPYKHPPRHQQGPLEALAAVTEHQSIRTKPPRRVRYHALFVTIPRIFDNIRRIMAKTTAAKRALTKTVKKSEPFYKRIVLKLSGESFQGPQGFGIHGETIQAIASELKDVHSLGVQIAIMVGGGNIFRGARQKGFEIDRATGDYMGMLATVINALALQDALEKQGVYTRVMSAIEMNQVAEPFIRRRALRHLEKGRIVIFAGGTGNPYFSTDTAASLRAMEIKADAILKATKVDGIYDADPEQIPDAKFFAAISYREVLNQNLKVMDSTAISLCKDNNLPIIIFNLNHRGNIRKVVIGEKIGSLVSA